MLYNVLNIPTKIQASFKYMCFDTINIVAWLENLTIINWVSERKKTTHNA